MLHADINCANEAFGQQWSIELSDSNTPCGFEFEFIFIDSIQTNKVVQEDRSVTFNLAVNELFYVRNNKGKKSTELYTTIIIAKQRINLFK